MIEKQRFDSYEDGYAVGWEEGRFRGFDEGYAEASMHYEQRLAAYWAELQTFNARMDYIETQMNKQI